MILSHGLAWGPSQLLYIVYGTMMCIVSIGYVVYETTRKWFPYIIYLSGHSNVKPPGMPDRLLGLKEKKE